MRHSKRKAVSSNVTLSPFANAAGVAVPVSTQFWDEVSQFAPVAPVHVTSFAAAVQQNSAQAAITERPRALLKRQVLLFSIVVFLSSLDCPTAAAGAPPHNVPGQSHTQYTTFFPKCGT